MIAKFTYAAVNPDSNKWAACFDVYSSKGFVTAELCSAQVFNTEAEAIDGGFRAIEILEATGKFPNMCEPF